MSFGNPKAENRIEVFYDCQCPTCVNFHAKLKAFVERFPEKVFVTIRHYPLPMHDNAFMASTVVEAARRQGKGVEMIDLLLQEQSRWSTSENPFPIMFDYAKQLGLDTKIFRTDLTGDDVARAVLVDMDRGKRLGLTYIPSTFLNGRLLSMSDTFDLENIISKGN
jgi:predicted DsbA family dithiol-disulfide isomerase